MKTLLLSICLFLAAQTLSAQDSWLYWKYKDYDGMALTVPGWLVDAGSWFLPEKAERKLMRRVDKVRFMMFENEQNPVSERDMKRFNRKAHRKHLEDLVTVRDGKTRVQVMGKESRKGLRKVVVLVYTPEEFVFVSVKGRLRWNDINKVMDKYNKENKKKEGKTLVPEVVKIPVSRV